MMFSTPRQPVNVLTCQLVNLPLRSYEFNVVVSLRPNEACKTFA